MVGPPPSAPPWTTRVPDQREPPADRRGILAGELPGVPGRAGHLDHQPAGERTAATATCPPGTAAAGAAGPGRAASLAAPLVVTGRRPGCVRERGQFPARRQHVVEPGGHPSRTPFAAVDELRQVARAARDTPRGPGSDSPRAAISATTSPRTACRGARPAHQHQPVRCGEALVVGKVEQGTHIGLVHLASMTSTYTDGLRRYGPALVLAQVRAGQARARLRRPRLRGRQLVEPRRRLFSDHPQASRYASRGRTGTGVPISAAISS